MTSLPEDQESTRLTPAVQWLIALNVAVFFLQVTLLGEANVRNGLGFSMGKLPDGWWTIGTYLFVHGSFWHFALNLYLLYLFGPRLEAAWGTRTFRNYYVWCGLGGWVVHALLFRDSVLIGSTAATVGLALAYGVKWSSEEVHVFLAVPIRVKWLAVLLIGVTLGAGAAGSWAGAGISHLAHAGGLVAGLLFLRTTSGAGIDRLRQRVSSVPDVPDELPRAVPRSMPRTRERAREVDEIVAQSQQALRGQQGRANPVAPARPSPDLDQVLDKISRSGIDSLTMDERRVLEERSRELRRE